MKKESNKVVMATYLFPNRNIATFGYDDKQIPELQGVSSKELHEKSNRKCPKCKSRFGVFLSRNIYIGLSTVICFNGDCDWSMNILEWNNKYKRSQFTDSGYQIKSSDLQNRHISQIKNH